MVEVKGWGMPFVSEGPTSIETCGVVCVCVCGGGSGWGSGLDTMTLLSVTMTIQTTK